MKVIMTLTGMQKHGMTTSMTDDYQITNRDKESFFHAKEVIKPWGGLDPMIAWCKSEMIDVWRWQLVDVSSHDRPGRYIFYFDSERDYLAFILKWS